VLYLYFRIYKGTLYNKIAKEKKK
jgi:hypothetical protein